MSLFRLSLANMRCNKGKTAVNILIIALALILFLVVNNLAAALAQYVNGMKALPKYRTLQVTYNRGFGSRETFEGTLKGMSHVKQVRQAASPLIGMIQDSAQKITDGAYEDYYYLTFQEFHPDVKIDLISGEYPKHPGEVVIPLNFQPYYDSYMSLTKEKIPYLNGKDFIGDTITFSFRDVQENWHQDKVTVVGVYDSVKVLEEASTAYLYQEDFIRLSKIRFEDPNYQPTDYEVVVDEYQNIPAVEKQMENYGAIPSRKTSLGGIGDFAFLMSGASAALSAVVIAFTLLIVCYLISSLIGKRKKLVALFQTLGYRNAKIFRMLLSEVLLIGLAGTLAANLLTALLFGPLWEPILTRFFSVYFLPLAIQWDYYWRTVLISAAAGCLIPLCALLFCYPKLAKIRPAEVLSDG